MEEVTFRPILLQGREKEKVERLLIDNNLKLESSLDFTVIGEKGDQVIATGSLAGPVIKCLATDKDYQGEGLTAQIISLLLEEEARLGNWHTFLYTSPTNTAVFHGLGFREVARVKDRVVLFESGSESIADFISYLVRGEKSAGKISSVVVNCNPFTKGHQFLLEKAAEECDWVYVFVVSEDLSLFPFDVRYKLVKEGTSHIKNLTLNAGGQYIISQSTFPSYFIRELNEQVEDHALLDVTIFGKYFVPALGITARYIGQEPYCPLTRTYNDILARELPQYGVKVFEINRLEIDGQAISASRVRQAIRDNNWLLLERYLPETTVSFLKSDKASHIIKKIKESRAPH